MPEITVYIPAPGLLVSPSSPWSGRGLLRPPFLLKSRLVIGFVVLLKTPSCYLSTWPRWEGIRFPLLLNYWDVVVDSVFFGSLVVKRSRTDSCVAFCSPATQNKQSRGHLVLLLTSLHPLKKPKCVILFLPFTFGTSTWWGFADQPWCWLEQDLCLQSLKPDSAHLKTLLHETCSCRIC